MPKSWQIARRLGADAARSAGTAAEVSALVAAQIEDAGERDAFLKSCGAPTTASTRGASSTPEQHACDPALLARLAQALAPHLGPLAQVVVNRAAKQSQSETELLNALAAEVPEPERKRFEATATFHATGCAKRSCDRERLEKLR